MSCSHINQFPSELLLEIFSLLSPSTVCICAKVCRLWRDAAANSLLWKGFATQLTSFFDKKELMGAQNLKSRVVDVILSSKLQIKETEEILPIEKWRLACIDNWVLRLRVESIMRNRTASPLPGVIRERTEVVLREKNRKEALIHVAPIRLALAQLGEAAKTKA
ncbi:MAG: hypothetical protein KR126chlam2_00615 [Chlamydiae bacterium]|nr:hypothetical protein [Chlamydiota bacterium]